MRYLKTYKIFESLSTEDVRENLTEICYELTDDRFGIKIYDDSDFPGWGHIPGTGMNAPRVERDDKILCIYLSNGDSRGFSLSEVREVVLRVIDYLGDRYKECSVLSVGENERSSIDKSEIAKSYLNMDYIANLIIIYR